MLRILKLVPDLPRLRISSIDSIEVDEALLQAIATEPRLMPHLHLSLQHGHDLILKRMKRRHSRADAVELVARIKAARPDIAIGADLIAGFPTETHEHHAANLSIIDELDIVHGHIFPYSPRPGTPAARMPQIARAVIKRRAAALRAAVAARRARWLSWIWSRPPNPLRCGRATLNMSAVSTPTAIVAIVHQRISCRGSSEPVRRSKPLA